MYLFFQTQLGSYKIFFMTESYLLALCKNDMQKEILRLFEVADITKISSPKYLTTIFRSLGRLVLENYMEKFILAFKLAGTRCTNLLFFFMIGITMQKCMDFLF